MLETVLFLTRSAGILRTVSQAWRIGRAIALARKKVPVFLELTSMRKQPPEGAMAWKEAYPGIPPCKTFQLYPSQTQ